MDLRDFAIGKPGQRPRDHRARVPGGALPAPRRVPTSAHFLRAREATRWPCARRACSRTRSRSPSPASTRRTCCRTTTSSWRSALAPAGRGGQARLRVGLHRAGQGLPLHDGSYRLEEEKMAVMMQQLVGSRTHDRFYPDFAGVARSYNFYPEPGHASRGRGGRRSPWAWGRPWSEATPACASARKYPRQIVSFSLRARRAAELPARVLRPGPQPLGRARRGLAGMSPLRLEAAEEDGTLAWLGSTYSPTTTIASSTASRGPGVRLVSFAQVLKHEAVPAGRAPARAAGALRRGVRASPVEIEFAGPGCRSPGQRRRFAFLQMRPLAMAGEQEQVTKIGDVDRRGRPGVPQPARARQRQAVERRARHGGRRPATSFERRCRASRGGRGGGAGSTRMLRKAQGSALPAGRRRPLGLLRPQPRDPRRAGTRSPARA